MYNIIQHSVFQNFQCLFSQSSQKTQLPQKRVQYTTSRCVIKYVKLMLFLSQSVHRRPCFRDACGVPWQCLKPASKYLHIGPFSFCFFMWTHDEALIRWCPDAFPCVCWQKDHSEISEHQKHGKVAKEGRVRWELFKLIAQLIAAAVRRVLETAPFKFLVYL